MKNSSRKILCDIDHKLRDAAMLAPLALASTSQANAGPLDPLVNYFQGNVVGALGTLATIGVGLFMLSRKADLAHIAIVCAGIWVITNAQTIASMFGNG